MELTERQIRDLLKRIQFAEADDCWPWLGQLNERGYGRKKVGKRRLMVHRLMYELFVGPIPDGFVVDHTCRNRACSNPAHLEPVTNLENIARGDTPMGHMLRTNHCVNGHEMTPENTIRNGKWRRCKQCRRTYNREWMRRSKKEDI